MFVKTKRIKKIWVVRVENHGYSDHYFFFKERKATKFSDTFTTGSIYVYREKIK